MMCFADRDAGAVVRSTFYKIETNDCCKGVPSENDH